MQFLLVRTQHGWVPGDEDAQDQTAKIKVGTTILVDYKHARNPKQHNLMFAILHRIFDAQRGDRYPNFDGFYVAIKWGLGWYDDVPVKNGLETDANGATTIPVLWSLEWSQLSQEKFEPMLEQVLALAERYDIPTADLRAEHASPPRVPTNGLWRGLRNCNGDWDERRTLLGRWPARA